MPGQKKIYTAGEKEHINYRERSQKGVPVNHALWNEMKAVAVEYKLDRFYDLFDII
jgi:LDH2 family malate/lactate/ureidoglycolate dehydrogenase